MGFKDVFKKTLPYLATALPLPSPIGNFAAKVIGDAIGTPDLKPDGVDEALSKTQMTPDVIERLKAGENTFQEHMRQMGFDTLTKLEEIQERDRESARARQIATKDSTPDNIAYITMCALFGLIALLCFHDVPQGAKELISATVGALTGAYLSQNNYFFGSSSGSAEKTKLIADIAKQ